MKIRKPNRLREYDYSTSGWYYVTICTQDHVNHFGRVQNEKMVLNEMGKITNKYSHDVPQHYPNASLDEIIIMPNHIHAIIIIDYDNVGDENFRPNYAKNKVEDKNKKRNENIHSLQRTNLSNIVKGFKIGVTKWCRVNNQNHFKWQRSFYDRIIRNEKELFNIRKYIQQNPLKWSLKKDIVNLDL